MPTVSLQIVVFVLTALAAVVVVLTRMRLGAGATDDGRAQVGRLLVDVHTGAGTLALVTWLVLLLGGDRLGDATSAIVGIVALAFWWILTLAGLMILARWLPSRGKHATGADDSWTDGPGLSILGHVGMVAGVAVFTYAYLTSAV